MEGVDSFVEFRGRVSNGVLEADEVTELSRDFDAKLYQKVVEMMHGPFKELFYGD